MVFPWVSEIMTEETPTWKPGCKAIVSSTGEQCGAGSDDVCGTHEKSRSITRVDDFETSPNDQLRDELIQECDIHGSVAFKLATLADTPEALWKRLTAFKEVEVAGETWDVRKTVSYGDDVARHPELDVEYHPLSYENCIAVIDEGSFGDNYQCRTGSYGDNLLCGNHAKANDPDTILDEDYDDGPDLEEIYVDGDDGHWLVEERGTDAIVVTPDYDVERINGDRVVNLEDDEGDDAGDGSLAENGWIRCDLTDRLAYTAFGGTQRVGVTELEDGRYEAAMTDSETRVVFATVDDQTEAENIVEHWLEIHDGDDVEEILAGEIELNDVDRYAYSQDPPGYEVLEEDDDVEVQLEDGRNYRGTVVDVGYGGWDTPSDEVHYALYLDVSDHVSESMFPQGTLVIRTHRDAADQWSRPVAYDSRIGGDTDSEDKELGDVEHLIVLVNLDEEQDGATFVCEDCENRVEDVNMRVTTCVECGGSMTVATDGEGPTDADQDDDGGDAGDESSSVLTTPLDGKTAVLVGCGDAKLDKPAPARDLYTSSFFQLKRRYAEAVGDYWYVLSAEHALVAPNEVLEPYDTEIGEVDGNAWEERVRSELPPLMGATVVVLAGRDYVEAGDLETTLEMYADDVEYPLEGMGMFDQQEWLSEQLDELEATPISADDLPKYLREGFEKQSPETLRRIAPYVEELADEMEAEREEKRAREIDRWNDAAWEDEMAEALENFDGEADDVLDEWDEESWRDEMEDALEEVDISPGKGTIVTKTIDGRGYFYLQWWDGEGTKRQYVAPVVPSDG